MEKKMMYAVVAIVAVLIVAGIGAALLLNNNSSTTTTNKVNVLNISKTNTSAAYSPLDQAAVYNNSYALARYLYLYTNGVPDTNSSVNKWLNFVLSDKGQQDVVNSGFYALQPSDLAAMKAQLNTTNATGPTGDFKESGSTTMGEISLLWADQFKNDTGITVTISQPGSGTGIVNFYSGLADVAQSSRAMTSAEKATATSKGINVTEWKVAVDGLAIIVNPAVTVNNLTLSQLEGIFNGTYTNWNQVGGNDQTIQLYGRDSASGSYASFKDQVLKNGDNYSASMQQFNSNALIVPEVENNPGGIGYVGVGYAKQANGA